jgi:DNA-binding HxlR family transcriptional regulator
VADNPSESIGAANWDLASVRLVLDLIDGRWVLPIMRSLRVGRLRRSTLRRRVGPVADNVLTETLRWVESQELGSRSAIPSVPVEVDYALTARALSLEAVLRSIDSWARDNFGSN